MTNPHAKAIEAASKAILANIEMVSVSGGVIASGYEKAAQAAVTAYLAAMEAAGEVLAPVSPTPAMIAEGRERDPLACDVDAGDAQMVYGRIWEAMIAARPREEDK